MRSEWFAALLLSQVPVAAAHAAPGAGQGEVQDLSGLSIEELAQLPVRSASKQEEPLSAAATSLYVITGNDIQRSSATSLPEALRLAPNLHVERVNATQYAITARGFNGVEPSNKLLVLVDGRSVYSTLHSGVFWELHSPLLEDLQQIEVISGPGGTLYGPNAVNGVINVLSKEAGETQGLLARGTAGSRERTAGVRYGMALGEHAALRVSANYFDREGMPTGVGPAADDAIRGWQAGFRADAGEGADHFTVQGNIFDTQTFLVDGDGDHGHNVLARWRRELTGKSAFQVQAYHDYFERRGLLTLDRLSTLDVEGQYNLNADRHDLVVGLGVRTSSDEFINNLNAFQLDPRKDRLWIWNGFVQDRFALSPKVSVIAGVKLEGSSFTGVQVLPNLRLVWQPGDAATFWASVSRAVRTPSRIDRDLMAPGFLARAPDFASEKLIAFEAGYRGRLSSETSLSVSFFYNVYDDLRSVRFTSPSPVFFPLQLANDIRGHTYGLEAWGTQQLAAWWRVSAGAALLHKEFTTDPGTIDLTSAASIGRDPNYQFSLRSQMNPVADVQLDAALRAVGPLEQPHVDGYVEADARLGWGLSEAVELYVAGTNLLHASHVESNDVQRTQRIARSVHLGTRLRF